MNEKSRLVLRVVASLYLIYLGFQLIRDVLQNRPENMVPMIAAGGAFAFVGVAVVVYSFREFYKYNRRDSIEEEDSDSSASKETGATLDLSTLQKEDSDMISSALQKQKELDAVKHAKRRNTNGEENCLKNTADVLDEKDTSENIITITDADDDLKDMTEVIDEEEK